MKFYKIVNPNHHDWIMGKEGNPIPFYREGILAFLDCDTELYEVKPLANVHKVPNSSPKTWECNSIKYTYIGKVFDNIKFLVEQGADIHVYVDFPLRWAVINNHLELVKYLVAHGADISVVSHTILLGCILEGDRQEMVDYIKSQMK